MNHDGLLLRRQHADSPSQCSFASKMAMIQDVPDRQRMEEELRRKEGQFRTLFGNISHCIARFDLNLRHVYVNQALSHPCSS